MKILFDQLSSVAEGIIALSTFEVTVTEKVPSISISCEAKTTSVNTTLKDEKTLEINCKS